MNRITSYIDKAFDNIQPSEELESHWEVQPSGPMVIAVNPEATEYTVTEAEAKKHYRQIAGRAAIELRTNDLADAIRKAEEK